MSDFSVTYTETKKRAIEEAIGELKANSVEKQLIGPKGSNEKMWVAKKNSSLGSKILNRDGKYKQYPSYTHDGEEFLIFSIFKG